MDRRVVGDRWRVFGSLGLIAGLLTRFTAASFMVIMLGAITTSHLQNGFFMNWFGKQQGEGYEYHLLVIGIEPRAPCRTGAGKWSVDKVIAERDCARDSQPMNFTEQNMATTQTFRLVANDEHSDRPATSRVIRWRPTTTCWMPILRR